MKPTPARRPSPSLVISIVALVIALGGSAYAAVNLPKNSVGARQLKRNAVTTPKIRNRAVTAAKVRDGAIDGAKVADRSLTGADIDLDTLGTVPAARRAQTVDSLPPAEPTHFVGSPGEPPFENAASNLGPESGVTPARVGFFKDHSGVVHLQGMVRQGTTLDAVFTLPEGFRPAPGTGVAQRVLCEPSEKCNTSDPGPYIAVFGSNTTVEGVPRSGQVVVFAEAGASVSLDGLSFRAES